jgi:glycosyltransferase involved in cell wall biosynthesis
MSIYTEKRIVVIIPAFNEADAVGLVVNEIPAFVNEVIVVDNNSTDQTAEVARKAGATVLFEKQKGYGKACLKGIDFLENKSEKPDIVVFLDADYSDYPQQMGRVIQPIIDQKAQLVIGSRELGIREKGSMTIPQVFGNRLSSFLLKLLYGASFTDLGPFRAITYKALLSLNMRDQNFGWTVEMQVKALKQKLPYCEVPVDYKNRIGHSKVSGTFKGSVMAGYKIITTIFKYL